MLVMDIKIQCCGIVLMLVMIYFYSRQKKVQLNTEKAFWRVFCVTLACISLDVISLYAIKYINVLPRILVSIICRAYLTSLVLVALCSLIYICLDVYKKRSEYRKVIFHWLYIAAPAAILIFVLPIHYQHKEGTVYYTDC